MAYRRKHIETRLEALLPSSGETPRALGDVARYGLLSPGKRLRPLMAVLSTAHFGGDEFEALDFACAVEMVHAASLILDDLPCMDDAAMRRGRPTVHTAFGEDLAILGAVTLLNHAFAVTSRAPGLSAGDRLALVALLSETVGFAGLVAGQTRDLRETTPSTEALDGINRQKTGALFVASIEGGALIARAPEHVRTKARKFAAGLGLAFQLRDDLLDLLGDEKSLGKDVGQDRGKDTMPNLVGIRKTETALKTALDSALAYLPPPFARGPLVELARHCISVPSNVPPEPVTHA